MIKIYDHPALIHAHDVSDICRPLHLLNISSFSHVRIDNEGKFCGISNNPDFHVHYVKNHYYNADIHLARNNELGKFILWDALSCTGDTEQMNQDAVDFGVQHTFTIIDKNVTGKNYYHFSTHLHDKTINQEYLRNFELLKLFILHFNEKVKESKVLTSSYDVKYEIDKKADFIVHSEDNLITGNIRLEFLRALKINSSSIGNQLSLREFEILSWLHQGKTLCQIASILGVRQITINKHIANIKEKTKSYTQFQLGEYFSRFLSP